MKTFEEWWEGYAPTARKDSPGYFAAKVAWEACLTAKEAGGQEVPCTDGLSLPLSEQEIGQIESQLETELGWRYTPQMRHGFKMEKLWNKLVEARCELSKRAR